MSSFSWKRSLQQTTGRLIRIVKLFLVALLIVYLALCGYLRWKEPQLVFPGAANPVPAPGDGGLAAASSIQWVTYQTGDGVELTGCFCAHPQPRQFVIFFHGNGEHAARLDGWASELSQRWKASVLVAEYRGFADDHSVPSEEGLILDGLAASRWMQDHCQLGPQQLVYYGRSIGGGVALAVAETNGGRALILERTFDRLVDVAQQRLQWLPINLLMQNRFDSLKRMEGYDGPLYQIHGDADRLIPWQNGRRLFEVSSDPEKVWRLVSGMGHNDPLPASCLEEVQRWLAERKY